MQQAGDLLNTAVAHHRAGRVAEAERGYEAVLAIDPRNVNALNMLGIIKAQRSELGKAEQLIASALRHAPAAPLILMNYGNVLAAQDRHQEALTHFDKAVALDNTLVGAWINRALSLRAVGRWAEALTSVDRALGLSPATADLCSLRGEMLLELGRHQDAWQSFEQALRMNPRFVPARFMQAQACIRQRRQSEALALLDQVLKLNPRHLPAHYLRALAALPYTAVTEAEATRASELFSGQVDALRTLGLENAHQGIGALTLFGLTYQEQNNRDLFAKYGALCADAMAHWQKPRAHSRAPRGNRRPRLCIVSEHIRSHSVWHTITRGLVAHLDRQRFELQLIYLNGTVEDAETAWARARCDRFVSGRKGFADWHGEIAACEADVIFYPEIGMEPTTLKLASLRLAPVQVTTWGHPHTTGLPTVDAFLSAQAFEPPNAQEHYTERLVCLPRLGCCYMPRAVPAADVDLAALGLEEDRHLLLSPGTPFKYAPQHDWMLAEIALRLGRARIVLFANNDLPDLNERLRQRLTEAFAARGLDFADHCAVLPWLGMPAFHALMRRARLMLDTVGFSGFNTAMQALQCGLPIAAYEGRFMRGRFASGVLHTVGLDDCVADDPRRYVELAVALATDDRRQELCRQRIGDAQAGLSSDRSVVREVEDYLLSVC